MSQITIKGDGLYPKATGYCFPPREFLIRISNPIPARFEEYHVVSMQNWIHKSDLETTPLRARRDLFPPGKDKLMEPVGPIFYGFYGVTDYDKYVAHVRSSRAEAWRDTDICVGDFGTLNKALLAAEGIGLITGSERLEVMSMAKGMERLR